MAAPRGAVPAPVESIITEMPDPRQYDHHSMERWGRTVCEFGTEVKGWEYARAYQERPTHATWILRNINSGKNFSASTRDYAKYVMLMRHFEEMPEQARWARPGDVGSEPQAEEEPFMDEEEEMAFREGREAPHR